MALRVALNVTVVLPPRGVGIEYLFFVNFIKSVPFSDFLRFFPSVLFLLKGNINIMFSSHVSLKLLLVVTV